MNKHDQTIAELSDAFQAFRRAMTATKDQWAGELELSHSQIHTLMWLSEHQRQTTGDVAGSLCVTPSAATQTLETLVRRGLVDRRQDETDRRVIRHALSPAGQKLTNHVRARRQQFIEDVAARLTPEQLQTAMSTMHAITDVVDEYRNRKDTPHAKS